MLIVCLLSFCMILPEFSLSIYANEISDNLETPFTKETQHTIYDISDNILQTGGLLDCVNFSRNSKTT